LWLSLRLVMCSPELRMPFEWDIRRKRLCGQRGVIRQGRRCIGLLLGLGPLHLPQLCLHHRDLVSRSAQNDKWFVNVKETSEISTTNPSFLFPSPLFIMLNVVGRPDSVMTFRCREPAVPYGAPGSTGACCANVTTSLRPRRSLLWAVLRAFSASYTIQAMQSA
jgi:hypothetical protein